MDWGNVMVLETRGVQLMWKILKDCMTNVIHSDNWGLLKQCFRDFWIKMCGIGKRIRNVKATTSQFLVIKVYIRKILASIYSSKNNLMQIYEMPFMTFLT